MKVRLKGNNIDGLICDVAGHVAQKLIDKGMAEKYEDSPIEDAIVEELEKVDEPPKLETAVLKPKKRKPRRKKDKDK